MILQENAYGVETWSRNIYHSASMDQVSQSKVDVFNTQKYVCFWSVTCKLVNVTFELPFSIKKEYDLNS